MQGILRYTILLVWGAITVSLTMMPAFAKPEKISREESQIVLNVENIKSHKIIYYYLGWDAAYATERTFVWYNDPDSKIYVQFLLNLLGPQYHFTSSGKITADGLKSGSNYFKNKSIVLGDKSSGVNSGSDASAGKPNHQFFTADGQNCVYLKRFSSLGPLGSETGGDYYVIYGYYCAPMGQSITADEAYSLLNDGVKFVLKPPASSNMTKIRLPSIDAISVP